MTKHAQYLEKVATDDKKEKEMKEKKEKKEKEEKEKKEKEEKEKKEMKEKKEKEKNAKASPEIPSYFKKYLSKSKQTDAKSFTKNIQERVNKTSMKLKAENEELKNQVEELKGKLDKANDENSELIETGKLRVRAEKALSLVNKMIDKKIIKAEDKEKNVEKLTVMDDISYSMMEDFVNGKEDSIATQAINKQASGKIKSGMKNLLLFPEQAQGFKDKLASVLMNRPKYAKLDEFKRKNLI